MGFLLLNHRIFRKILRVFAHLWFMKTFESTLTSKGIWSDGETISVVLVKVECSLFTEQGFHEFQLF